MSIILVSLKTIGLFSGAYVGYNYGFICKTNVYKSNVFFKKYDDLYINNKFNKNTISEKTFYNCIGLFTGIFLGYHVYPIIIPTMIYQVYNTYPNEINQFKKNCGIK